MIYILLPVHNGLKHTRAFIDCLKQQTCQAYHLLLIDDGTTDGTVELVQSELEKVTCLRGDGNLWWAGSLQKGFEWLEQHGAADDDVVLIMNNDCIVAPDFLQIAMTILCEEEGVLLLARAYNRDTGTLIDAGIHVDWRRLKFEKAVTPQQVNCLSTRGLFLTMKEFRIAGGFFPRLLPHYLSDYEFTIRAHKKGLRLVCDPRLTLWTDESSTGYHTVADESFAGFCRKFFSKKCAMNPVYWMAFVLLACPMPWKLRNMQRVLFRGIKSVVRRKA